MERGRLFDRIVLLVDTSSNRNIANTLHSNSSLVQHSPDEEIYPLGKVNATSIVDNALQCVLELAVSFFLDGAI